jgi:hypothetical protein
MRTLTGFPCTVVSVTDSGEAPAASTAFRRISFERAKKTVSAVIDRFGCRQVCRTDFSVGYPRLINAPRIPSVFAALERCRVISRTLPSAWARSDEH